MLNKFSLGAGYVWTLERRQKFLEQMLQNGAYSDYDIVNAQDVFATRAAVGSGLATVTTAHGYLTYEGIRKDPLRKVRFMRISCLRLNALDLQRHAKSLQSIRGLKIILNVKRALLAI